MEEENISKHLFQKYDLQTTPVHVSFAVLLYLHEDEKQEIVHQNLWEETYYFQTMMEQLYYQIPAQMTA
jgi:hypothetical protein